MRKKLKNNHWIWVFLLLIALISCNKEKKVEMLYTCPMPEDSVFSDKPGACPKCGMDLVKIEKKVPNTTEKVVYTCPMPEDSVFSDHPGACPKCGMDLIKMETDHRGHDHGAMQMKKHEAKVFTCPMHPEIIRDKPGQCPICGMDLVERINNQNAGKLGLGAIVEPVNQTVFSSVATVKPMQMNMPVTVEASGYINYNPKNTRSIASRYAGRIEKLYVKYNFQKITKGQKLMDIYSPELVTAQENLLFLLRSDPDNADAISSAKQQLGLLGMNENQISQVVKTGRSQSVVSIYSPVSGHLHEMNNTADISMAVMKMNQGNEKMNAGTQSEEFSIREGMYVERGQTIFSVIGTEKLWAILKIYADDVPKIKLNQSVAIYSEMNPKLKHEDEIDFIEPLFEKESKYLNVRVYLDQVINHHSLKIGSLIRAKIKAGSENGIWIPETAMLDLGNHHFVVFLKSGDVFKTQPVTIGIKLDHKIEIKNGLSLNNEIAANAQFMVDSEDFVSLTPTPLHRRGTN